MKPLGWTLTQCVSLKEEETGTPIGTEGDQMKTQGEEGHLQTKEMGLRGNQACCHPELRLPASELEKQEQTKHKIDRRK